MAAHQGVVSGWLDCQFRQSQHHACEHVDDDLLVDAARRLAKDPVSAEQTGHEAVYRLLLAVDVAQRQHTALVQQGKLGEVHGVLPRRSEYHLGLLLQGAGPEKEDHDQGVGEAHFGAVDGAIADGFEEDEGLFVFGVEDDALEGGLGRTVSACCIGSIANGVLPGAACMCRPWRDVVSVDGRHGR